MKTLVYLFTMVICFQNTSFAQTFLEPLIGYQKDLNNRPNFTQINTGVQLAFQKSNQYEFLLQIQKSLPVAQLTMDSAFTPNQVLPLYTGALKTIQPSIFSFAIGHRFRVTNRKNTNGFFILLSTGVSFQKIKVKYDYDKVNYTILNPDKTLSKVGPYIGAGVEYIRQLNTGRLFLQFCISTEPWARSTDYPSSFNFMAPLAINFGYSLPIKKNTNEKKTN